MKAERRWIIGVIVFAMLAVWATWKSVPRTTRIQILSRASDFAEWSQDKLGDNENADLDVVDATVLPEFPSSDKYPVEMFAISEGLGDPTLPWKEFAEYEARWWNSLLAQLGEPSLYAANREHKPEAYRFVWQRSFHQPVVVSVEVAPDGTGVAIGRKWRTLRSKPSEEKRASLSKSQVIEWRANLDRTGFWSMARYSGGAGLDGASWSLEGCRDGKLQLVNRWSPFPSPFADLCLDLLDFSGLSAWPVH